MNIGKAIEILSEYLRSYDMTSKGNFGNAVQLGLEALKRIQEERNPTDSTTTMRLPGETINTEGDKR